MTYEPVPMMGVKGFDCCVQRLVFVPDWCSRYESRRRITAKTQKTTAKIIAFPTAKARRATFGRVALAA